MVNKHEVIKAIAIISQRNHAINNNGRSENFLDENKSRASSKVSSGKNPKINLKI